MLRVIAAHPSVDPDRERLGQNPGESDAEDCVPLWSTGTFKQYFATSLKDHPNMGVGQDARLMLRPSGSSRWKLFDDFHRTIDPFAQTGASLVAGTPSDVRSAVRELRSRPDSASARASNSRHPAQLFRVGLGYRFDYDYFQGNEFANDRNLSHTISSDTSWEFLPKTALFWNGSVRFFKYTTTRRWRSRRTVTAPMLRARSASTAH